MDRKEYKYLKQSLELLNRWIPLSVGEMLEYYKNHSIDYDLQDDRYIYCIFSWKEDAYERIILLVYEDDKIIADCAAVHCDHHTLMNDTKFYDAMSEESDWMYLEHYILSNVLYPDEAYPHCEIHDQKIFVGEALLYTNAYVSKRVRRQSIFKTMDSLMRTFVLRKNEGNVRLGCIFSLDPDIACYGEDQKGEPYYYSFEKDEPVRIVNQEIAEHLGYEVIRLEETKEIIDDDGTKIWFGVRQENDVFLN